MLLRFQKNTAIKFEIQLLLVIGLTVDERQDVSVF